MHVLLGSPPRAQHDRLYRAYPASRGYLGKERDPILFEAVLTLALVQASKAEGEKSLHKVYFLVPATTERWVTDEFRASAKRIFAHLRDRRQAGAIKHIGQLFHQVMLGSQVFALPTEPERWVAFGFSALDPTPEWMRQKLLDLGPGQQDLSSGV